VIAFLFSILLSTAYAQTFPSHNVKILPEDAKFTYQSFDGETIIRCQHVLENPEAQDWLVQCKNKKYRVHLWVTIYQRPVEPQTSIEVLYWVSEFSGGLGGQATVWFNLRNASELSSLSIVQNVDENVAGLYLDLAVRPAVPLR
jgi:hypothetical protein